MSDLALALQLSDALAGVVSAVAPSVVAVEARRRVPSSGIVWSENTVVTANHTVEADEDIELSLADGRTLAASVAGRDPATDLALLSVEEGGLPVPQWADSAGLKVGHLVLSVARPGDAEWATHGIVSALGDAWRTRAGGRIDRYLQTDLDLFRGFSGSALADLGGRVVGLNTSGLLRGFSLAVPTETIRRVAQELQTRGKMQRGYLGISSYPVRLPEDLGSELGQAGALLIFSVQPESPAAKAGLMLGDVLAQLDGTPVAQFGELVELLDEERIGAEATIKLVRAGKPLDLKVTVGARAWG
jgi:S1-C subfamily serine protease